MIKQSFIGLAKPQIEYEVLVAGQPEPQLIQPSEKTTGASINSAI